jgi:hypothetical protein
MICDLAIQALNITSGAALPRRAQELVMEWATHHQQELLIDWKLCMDKLQPNQISPLR